MELNRRTFCISLAGLAGAGTTFFIVGCTNGEKTNTSDDSSGEDCQDEVQNGQISQNHGHTLMISKADIEAGMSKTYSIQGSSNHDHQITLTADDFAMIAAGAEITLTSTNVDQHTHEVTLRCA